MTLFECEEYDQTTVDLYCIERQTRGFRDGGEAEAVQQAAQTGARVIVDDPWGENLPHASNLSVTGASGFCAECTT